MDTRFVLLDGKKVKELRAKGHITQSTLAAKTGFTKSTIERIERNKTRFRHENLKRLADCLQVDPQDLIMSQAVLPPTAESLLSEIDTASRDLLRKSTGDDLFSRQHLASLEQLRTRLQQLQHGECVLDQVEPTPLALQLAKGLHRSLQATAFWPDDPMPPQARTEYLHYQAQAAAHGVDVRRLFMITPGMEADPALQARMQQDLHCNFLVKYRYMPAWLDVQHIASPVDVGVWDDECVWLYPPKDVHGMPLGYPVVYRNAESIAHYQEVFNANWSHSASIAIVKA